MLCQYEAQYLREGTVSTNMRYHVQLREDKDSHVEEEDSESGRYRIETDGDFREEILKQGRTIANK